MASLIQRQKTAKKQQHNYFTAKVKITLPSKTAVEELTEKVYKQLRTKTGGEKSSGNVRSKYIEHEDPPTWVNSPESRQRQHQIAVWAAQQIRSRKFSKWRHNARGVTTRRPDGHLDKLNEVNIQQRCRQKVSNLPKTGLEHDARPDNGRGKPVGQSSAPRSCSPGGRSPVRLLRGSISSEKRA